MVAYYGFPAISPATFESLSPAAIMDFEELRRAVATPGFEAAYRDKPLQGNEIAVVGFFAPKIANVRDPQTEGAPVGGFGWRKVLRFRARDESDTRAAGLEAFYLLFNFTSGREVTFPENTHAAQIQAMLVPAYPTNGRHLDAYFLVYQGLGTGTPERVSLYLVATFDLAGAVSDDDKYYVPRACGQCHGTERADQKGAKVNYLDTDHWVDRTADDFPTLPAPHVLVDGDASYPTCRLLNREIARQNKDVLAQSGGLPFAALAAEKWLDLHQEGQPDENRHVGVMRRGFRDAAGDRVWTGTESTDRELLPLLNQYCFRCHSSARYHVFQKEAVIGLKARILARVQSGNMPQDRVLDTRTRERIVAFIKQLQ